MGTCKIPFFKCHLGKEQTIYPILYVVYKWMFASFVMQFAIYTDLGDKSMNPIYIRKNQKRIS